MAADPFDLNLRHLRALLSIAEKGSITAAADSVSLSQPALTQGLAKLERQFGYTMFERRSGGMVPTPMGAIVIERTRAALDHLSQAAKGLSAVFQYPERLMTMTQLRAFLALAEAGGFSAAAQQRHVADRRASRGQRSGAYDRRPAGRAARARGVAQSGRAAAGARRPSGRGRDHRRRGRSGIRQRGRTDRLWRAAPGPPYLVPTAMARMVQSHPRAGFKVLEGSWRELVEPLRDGEIDMIVGALRPFEIADLYQMPLYEDRLVIAAGSRHPLAEVERPTLEQLGPIRGSSIPPIRRCASNGSNCSTAHLPKRPSNADR
jgi:DNA-binding transcriptional LysR family regulator